LVFEGSRARHRASRKQVEGFGPKERSFLQPY
jgi:hypothetical protein